MAESAADFIFHTDKNNCVSFEATTLPIFNKIIRSHQKTSVALFSDKGNINSHPFNFCELGGRCFVFSKSLFLNIACHFFRQFFQKYKHLMFYNEQDYFIGSKTLI